jgi:hypothetical protein
VLTIFPLEREEDRSWRKLHNDEPHSLYSSPNIVRVIKSRRMKWAGHVARRGRGEVFTMFLLGGTNGRELGRHRRRIHGANWIQLAQDRVQWRAFVSTVMNLRVP